MFLLKKLRSWWFAGVAAYKKCIIGGSLLGRQHKIGRLIPSAAARYVAIRNGRVVGWVGAHGVYTAWQVYHKFTVFIGFGSRYAGRIGQVTAVFVKIERLVGVGLRCAGLRQYFLRRAGSAAILVGVCDLCGNARGCYCAFVSMRLE